MGQGFGIFHRHRRPHFSQGAIDLLEVEHGRPRQHRHAMHRGFQGIVPANGHQTAANEGQPDLRVLLAASRAPRTREEVELGNLEIELGHLKGNIGNQNYEIPPEVDLSLYNSVVIYCQEFHVVFSTATI